MRYWLFFIVMKKTKHSVSVAIDYKTSSRCIRILNLKRVLTYHDKKNNYYLKKYTNDKIARAEPSRELKLFSGQQQIFFDQLISYLKKRYHAIAFSAKSMIHWHSTAHNTFFT